MRKELTTGALVLALAVGLVGTATAQDSGDSQVNVTVASDVAIDVRPSTLDYTATNGYEALDPGAKRRVSDGGYEYLELENIGSEVLDNIYIEATVQNNNAFGDSAANNHDTGNFVTVSTKKANDDGYSINGLTNIQDHHYVNRVEFFEGDRYPTYLDVATSADQTVDQVSITNSFQKVGRFRVGSAEYFFVIYSDAETNPSNVGLRVGRSPHTPTQLGTTDFTDSGTDLYEANLTQNPTGNVYALDSMDLISFNESNYEGGSLLDDTGSSAVTGSNEQGNISENSASDDVEIRNYAHFFDIENGYALRSALNTDPKSTDGGTTWSLTGQGGSRAGIQPIVSASNSEDGLQPGQNFPLNVGVQVPLGVDNSRVSQGTVTVNAQQFS